MNSSNRPVHTLPENSISDKEIVTFFNAKFPNVSLDLAGLRNVKGKTVEDCLIALLSTIYGLEASFFNDESDPQHRILTLVSLMQRAVGDFNPDFGICFTVTDLLFPKPTRIVKFLGLLIEFYQFVEQESGFIDDVLNEVNTFNQKQTEVKQSVHNLQNIYDREMALIQEDEQAIAELIGQQQAASLEMEELVAQKEKLKSESIECEELITAGVAKCGQLENTVEELKIESANLNDEIIQSPEQLFADIAQAETELKEAKETVNNLKRQLRENDNHKHEIEVLREQCNSAHADITATIKTNMDNVSKYRAEEAQAAESLKKKQELVSAIDRHHEDIKSQCDAEIVALRDNIAITEGKVQNVLRQIEIHLKNAEELEEFNPAHEEAIKTEKLKQIKTELVKMHEDHAAFLSRINAKKQALKNKVADAENKHNYMVKFVDKCIDNVESHPIVIEIKKAVDYIAKLENKKKQLQKNESLL